MEYKDGIFPLLDAGDIECRVQQVTDKGVSLLLYKTARTDAKYLDAIIGPFNWQCDYKLIGNTLYCGIGVRDDKTGQWIFKWDAGSETKVEAEKGAASDAFKRAGTRFGIGRELYTAPFIWVPADKVTIKDGKTYDKFTVTDIGYESGQISRLTIANAKNGEIVYSYGKIAPAQKKAGKKATSMKAEDLGLSAAPSNVVTDEHWDTLIGLCKAKFGADAGKRFKELTGVRKRADLTEADYPIVLAQVEEAV